MTLSEEVASLQRAAHDLMYLGMDGSPIYSDDLSRRNNEVSPFYPHSLMFEPIHLIFLRIY